MCLVLPQAENQLASMQKEMKENMETAQKDVSLLDCFSGRKPRTIVRHFDRNRSHSLQPFYSSLEGATELKFVPFYSP